MLRKKIAEKICSLVINGKKLSLQELESCKCKEDEYKNGLYFLYNDENTCIYIGKVGDTPDTSLYHRMVGHGSGSHKVKDSRWYNNIKYGKWYKFNTDDKTLSKLERLAIYGMEQPIYNDCDTDNESIKKIEEIFGRCYN